MLSDYYPTSQHSKVSIKGETMSHLNAAKLKISLTPPSTSYLFHSSHLCKDFIILPGFTYSVFNLPHICNKSPSPINSTATILTIYSYAGQLTPTVRNLINPYHRPNWSSLSRGHLFCTPLNNILKNQRFNECSSVKTSINSMLPLKQILNSPQPDFRLSLQPHSGQPPNVPSSISSKIGHHSLAYVVLALLLCLYSCYYF